MSARNFYIMQSAVAPMQSELPCYTPLTNHATDVHTVALVFASDYAALEAECERMRQSLTKINDRCEAFVGDDSGMQVHSVEVLMNIATRGLGSSL